MKIFLTLALALTLASCAGTTQRIEPARLNEVQKGQTTVTQIVRQFGRPSILSKNPDGTQIAMYLYGDDPSSGTTIVPLFTSVQRDAVTFYFDTEGVLTNVKTTEVSAGKTAPDEPKPAPADVNKTPSATQTTQVSTAKSTPTTDKPAPTNAANTPQATSKWWSLPTLQPSGTTENR